jgi:phosphoglycolate phosphatase
MRLVLWDIDGTLVHAGHAGLHAFEAAFEQVVGRPPSELAPMAGRTDWAIGLDILERNGIEDGPALWPAFSAALAEALAARADALREHGWALPGAHEAVGALHEHDEVVQSVLTGNLRPNAATKLGAFGLDRLLDLEIGAYGSDHHERPELVPIARARAEARHGAELAPEEIVLVGDTPRDVDAARAHGTRAVGVATGRYSERELDEAGAHAVLPDLSDLAAVLAAVTSPNGARP